MQYETLVRADREVRKYLSKVALKEEASGGSSEDCDLQEESESSSEDWGLQEDCPEDDIDSCLGDDEETSEDEGGWNTGLSKEDESVLDKAFGEELANEFISADCWGSSSQELKDAFGGSQSQELKDAFGGSQSQCKDIFSKAPASSIFDSCQGNYFGAGEPIEFDYCPDFYATDDESREDFASGFVYAIMISMGIQDDQFAHNAEIIAQAEFIKD